MNTINKSAIPCLDLKGQHKQVHDEIFASFEKVYENTAFSGGPFVEEFEKNFAAYTGANRCVAVNTGTSALHLAFKALGIGNGDEVILPANTFIATAWGITYTGAKPVFVDCDPLTWQIDVGKIEAAITTKTKAVVGVHLYGQAFDADGVLAICKKHNIHLIEDAAQAQGTLYKGKKAGNFGSVSCFSFYPGKNLGACGEGGCIITQSDEIANHVASLRNHGSTQRYFHDEIGYNYRMGGFEGASLTVKLKYLDSWNSSRRKIASKYLNSIKNPAIQFQKVNDSTDGIWHLCVVTMEDKDRFVKHLTENSIIPAYHYPVPCHLQKAYSSLGYQSGDFPASEYLASHCVSLPMYAELSEEQTDHVIKVINQY